MSLKELDAARFASMLMEEPEQSTCRYCGQPGGLQEVHRSNAFGFFIVCKKCGQSNFINRP